MDPKSNYAVGSICRTIPPFLLILSLFPGMLLAPPSAQAKGSPQTAKEQPRPVVAPRQNPVTAELEVLSGCAEEVFELAMAGNMDRAAKKLDPLRKHCAGFPYLQDDMNAMLLPRLRQTMSDLEHALAGKDRLDAMRYANRITLIAATVAAPLKPSLPTEVSLLEYNARELGIWSETKRREKLSNIVIRMHLAWQSLMPKLIDHNATKELRRFSELMGRLEGAKSPEEYGRVSRQVTGELTGMKSIFLKASR